ncbi:hypothetical protein PX983_RS22345 [Escherichia coli]|nr:hypothetical protein [Escherichia coli]
MSRINKQLNASNSNIYTPVFVESILKVNIPVSIYLKSADHFDDKYISSTSDSWVFDYSGSRCYAHFRQDKISNQLIKYICFHYASAKCPAQVPGVLHAWSLATDHCISKSAFTFTVLKEYITQTTSSFRGRAGQRDKTSKALSKRGVLPAQEIPGPKNSKAIYYSKTDLNHYIKTEFGLTNANEPCTHAWMENGKRYQVNYEDLLFLHEKGSLALKRTLALLATPIPFTNTLMNKFLGNVEPDGSVFSKYQLLEEDGTSTRMRTHIPRHNINTFLAIAEISDHLQAMLMGRVDITQNQHYQHLALAGRRKAASLMPLQPISTALTATPYSSSVATPLDIVKQTGQLAATEHMAMDNTIKANLHTFDDRDDVARFIEASFADGLFEDVAAAFEEIRTAEGPEQASAMVARHAVLYPLKFGSCMREVNLWGCPYRLKCQSAAFCEHFTLTGRMDELPNLIAKKQALQKAYSKLTQLTQRQPDYQTRLADIEKRLHQLKAIQAQWQRRAKTQQLVATENVLSGEVITEGKVRTLAQLFALEYQQLMKEND